VADPRQPESHTISSVIDWAVANLDSDLSVDALATRAAMSTRTLMRQFRATTGLTPAAWVRRQRLGLAERLLERDDTTMTTIARTCGLGTADTLRRHFIRARGVTPAQYRHAFRAC
jgi:AraC family transcriptional regulator, transcriptional activator FtrA